MLEEAVRSNTIYFTLLASGLLVVLTTISVLMKKKTEFISLMLFWSMITVIVLNTIYLAGSTIYVNMKSIHGGPVHFHADIEIYNCGKKLDIVDPKGWSNKVGTPTLHEHNDGRIHVEGVVTAPEEISLGRFFAVIGGRFMGSDLRVPTVDGMVDMMDGGICNGMPAKIQTFVYKTVGDVYNVGKIENGEGYMLSPHSQVPPGDCIIIEYGPEMSSTQHLCQQYQVKEQLGKIHKL